MTGELIRRFGIATRTIMTSIGETNGPEKLEAITSLTFEDLHSIASGNLPKLQAMMKDSL